VENCSVVAVSPQVVAVNLVFVAAWGDSALAVLSVGAKGLLQALASLFAEVWVWVSVQQVGEFAALLVFEQVWVAFGEQALLAFAHLAEG